MTDMEFEALLKSSLIKAAKQDYFVDLPDASSLPEPSAVFEHRMKKLLKAPSSFVRRRRTPVYKTVLRTVAMFFLVISVLFGSIMLHPEVRAKVIDIITKWFFSDHTEYRFTDKTSIPLDGNFTLGYLPQGFTLLDSFKSDLQSFYIFRNNGDIIDIEISTASVAPHIDKVHSTHYQIEINGSAADVFESISEFNQSIVIWYDEDNKIFIVVTGTVGVNEMIKIVQHINLH